MSTSSVRAGLPGGAPPPLQLRPASSSAVSAWCGPRQTATRCLANADHQKLTPLLDAVQSRGNSASDVPFHVPGHKRGLSTPPALRGLVGDSLRYDLTELEGLDYLASPTGPIREAQQLAAQLWGAASTWFLVNGTTVGVHAAVMATCGPRDTLLLPRNAHLSAFNAMVLAGCQARYMQPQYDPYFGVAHHVTVAALEQALGEAQQSQQRVGAVLVVSPTYYGVLSDVRGLAQVCHRHGVPLIVDEAHGAHLGLSPELPNSALQQGADIVVQSTHKQLSAMTQAAMLHSQGGLVSHSKVARALQVLQSSSPSYLLMASLDAARQQAASPGVFSEPLAAAELARRSLQSIPGVRILSQEHLQPQYSSKRYGGGAGREQPARRCGEGAGADLDPLRLTLSFADIGLTGYEAAEVLERDYGVVPELAAPGCVVLAMSVGSTRAHAACLVAAVQQLSELYSSVEACDGIATSHQQALEYLSSISQQPVMSPREAYQAESVRVQVADAIGSSSAELLCPYPPGVPIVFPGEVISAAIVEALDAVLQSGGRVSGVCGQQLVTMAVLVEQSEAEIM